MERQAAEEAEMAAPAETELCTAAEAAGIITRMATEEMEGTEELMAGEVEEDTLIQPPTEAAVLAENMAVLAEMEMEATVPPASYSQTQSRRFSHLSSPMHHLPEEAVAVVETAKAGEVADTEAPVEALQVAEVAILARAVHLPAAVAVMAVLAVMDH